MAHQETTEAIVVRGVDFSETSRVITLLTPGRGRVAVMARGVRRKNSPLASTLDTFNRIEAVLYWKDGRGVQTLGDTALLDGYPAIKRDLERNAYAAFPLEVAYKAAHENEPSEAFFAALVRGMDSLTAWRGNARDHAAWQVLRLMSAAGFAPMLDACSHCGGELPEAPGFAWDHGAVCTRCPGDKRLRAETFAALRAWCAAADVCPKVAAGVEAFMVVRQYAARHLDSDFRSVRVIDRMFDAGG